MIKSTIKSKLIVIGALIIAVLSGCNKNFPNLLNEFGEAKDPTQIKDKVLLIVVDGLSGQAVQDLEPVNFTNLIRNGMVSYGSLADPSVSYPITNPAVVTQLLTGVYSAKNGVTDNLDTYAAQAYPTIFTRLNGMSTPRKSTFISSNSSYVNAFGKDAHVIQDANDQAVTTKAQEDLQTDTSDLVVLQYGNVEAVGAANGYVSTNSNYAQAIRQVDKQIADVVTTLKSRKNYSNENWLVIITSGKGGKNGQPQTDFTPYGDTERQTFTLFYSPKFARKIISRPDATQIPFIGNAPIYSYNNNVVGTVGNNVTGNIEASKSYTINFFYKTNFLGEIYYPGLVAKRGSADGGPGWCFLLNGSNIQFHTSMGVSTSSGVNLNDGNWHTITGVIDRAALTLRVYIDGIPGSVVNISSASTARNDLPLIIGKMPSYGGVNNTNFSVVNLQVYERAFTPVDINKYAGLGNIESSHPYYGSLMGYWPAYDDVNKSVVKEMSGKSNNITLSGNYSWVSFNETVKFIQPKISTSFFRLVPNAVDIPFIIYQWLGVSISENWQLDGKSWSPSYTQIKS